MQCSVASHTETSASLARIWEDNLGAGASGLSKPNRIILVAVLRKMSQVKVEAAATAFY